MAKKWLLRLCALVLAMVLLLCACAYCIDPYMQYRVRDNTYLLNSRLVTPGLIKNYDYDTVLIGSSMIQNTDMQLFRDTLGGRPLKITTGAISLTEISKLTQKIQELGKAENYYICLDQYLFQKEIWDDMDRFPDYLMDEHLYNDYRYLLGYETWMRFIPIDLALSAAKALGISLPEKFSQATSIDYLEDWRQDWQFGTQYVLNSYSPPAAAQQEDCEIMYSRMVNRLESYLSLLDFQKGSYTFFFPPYSALFWHYAYQAGYGETYLKLKAYAIDRLAEYDNVEVYDFQADSLICDLDNYKDYTHYAPEINDWMLTCMANGTLRCTGKADIHQICSQIEAHIQTLLQTYPQIP